MCGTRRRHGYRSRRRMPRRRRRSLSRRLHPRLLLRHPTWTRRLTCRRTSGGATSWSRPARSSGPLIGGAIVESVSRLVDGSVPSTPAASSGAGAQAPASQPPVIRPTLQRLPPTAGATHASDDGANPRPDDSPSVAPPTQRRVGLGAPLPARSVQRAPSKDLAKLARSDSAPSGMGSAPVMRASTSEAPGSDDGRIAPAAEATHGDVDEAVQRDGDEPLQRDARGAAATGRRRVAIGAATGRPAAHAGRRACGQREPDNRRTDAAARRTCPGRQAPARLARGGEFPRRRAARSRAAAAGGGGCPFRHARPPPDLRTAVCGPSAAGHRRTGGRRSTRRCFVGVGEHRPRRRRRRCPAVEGPAFRAAGLRAAHRARAHALGSGSLRPRRTHPAGWSSPEWSPRRRRFRRSAVRAPEQGRSRASVWRARAAPGARARGTAVHGTGIHRSKASPVAGGG